METVRSRLSAQHDGMQNFNNVLGNLILSRRIADAPELSSPATSTAPRRDRTRTAAVVATACVAVAVALYLGREFFAPLAVAIVLSVLLRPVVRALGRVRLPAPAGAAVVILGLLGVTAGAAVLLAQPVRDWVAAAPARFQEAERKLRRLPQPLSRAADAIGRSSAATGSQKETQQGSQQSGNDGPSSAAPDPARPRPPSPSSAPPPKPWARWSRCWSCCCSCWRRGTGSTASSWRSCRGRSEIVVTE